MRRAVLLATVVVLLGLVATVGTAAGQTAACTVAPEAPESGESVEIDAGASSGAELYRFDREGDGTWDTDERAEPTYVTSYDTGTYEPRVQAIEDGTGDTDTASCGAVTVATNQPPSASIAVDPETPEPGAEATLDGSGSTDADGTIVLYAWRVDGEVVAESDTPTTAVAFEAEGDHEVAVTVTDDDGDTDTASTTVDVGVNTPPTASLSASNETARPGEAVTFDASASSDNDSLIATYDFDVDGDGVPEEGGGSAEYRYAFPEPGNYTVSVTVTDDDGATATANATVTVAAASGEDGPPDDDAVHPRLDQSSTVRVGEEVTLAAGLDDWPNASYRWRVDGETAGNGQRLDHTFDAPGDHLVSVTVSGQDWNRTGERSVAVAPADRPVNATLLAAIDADDDGRINDTEVLEAIEHWHEATPVPGTGGMTIDDTSILHVIEAWRTGAPVGP